MFTSIRWLGPIGLFHGRLLIACVQYPRARTNSVPGRLLVACTVFSKLGLRQCDKRQRDNASIYEGFRDTLKYGNIFPFEP